MGMSRREDSVTATAAAAATLPIPPSTTTATTTAIDEMIRHSGPAHIRGRIRRVWRARFLELHANGTLHYYSSETMHKKYTLLVHHARILDVTTLRDLHVGLPRGSFGFLVRGQREDSCDRARTTVADGSSDTAVIHNNGDNNNNSSSNNNNYNSSSTIPPDDLLYNLMLDQPVRDYFCAVPTLEDAQMWVVALQWAASLQPKATTAAVQDQWWKVDYAMPTTTTPPTPPRTSSLTNVPTTPDGTMRTTASIANRQATTTATALSEGLGPPPAAPQTKPLPNNNNNNHTSRQQRQGKILVSRAVGYTIVRSSMFQVEIAYEIQALLLNHHHHHDNNNNNNNYYTATATTGGTNSSSGKKRARLADQWTVRRTASDIETLVQTMGRNSMSTSSSTRALTQSELLQRTHLPRWRTRPSPLEVERSLSIVDSLLRTWVLDADLINTRALQEFLGMDVTAATTTAATTQQEGGGSSWTKTLRDWSRPYSLPVKTQVVVQSHVSNDQFVKQWLQSRSTNANSIKKPSFHSWMLQVRHDHAHILALSGAVAATACVGAPSAYRWWQRCMPVVSLRLDVLMVSWLGATYMGLRMTQSNDRGAPRPRTTSAASRKRHSRMSQETTTTKQATASPSRTPQKQRDANLNQSCNDSVALLQTDSPVVVSNEDDDFDDFRSTGSKEIVEDDYESSDGEESGISHQDDAADLDTLSSPLPRYPDNDRVSCWSQPASDLFYVRGPNYLNDKLKVLSGPGPLQCRGVDIWLSDNPVRHIARHPSVLGGKLGEADTFLVNFLLPFGNFVAYFSIPPVETFPDKLKGVWTKFLQGNQQYRDARLKLLPVVVDGPWIVKTAVGPGKSPALLGKVIPLQYFFRDPENGTKGSYEIDVIITASAIAKGILSVVKSQTKSVSIAFAFIIEAAEQSELPETVLCTFQIHSINLEDCPRLPECNLDGDIDD